MAIYKGSRQYTHGSGNHTITSVSGWSPADTDVITVQPYNLDMSNNLNQDPHIPNINMWAVWNSSASNWYVISSDSSFNGTYFYIIRTS